MITIRLAATCCTLMTLVLLNRISIANLKKQPIFLQTIA